MTNQNLSGAQAFAPDWVSPPGDTILDLLEERDWTQNQLAERLGYTTKHVSQLINGKVPLTEDAAMRLQNVLGASAGFWLKREAIYRERIVLLETAEKYAQMTDWLDRFPIKALMDVNALPKCRIDAKSKPALVGQLLAFFGVATPDQWEEHYGGMQLQFRRSREEQSNIEAISAWLRLGEMKAEKQTLPNYNEAKFKRNLELIRQLTNLSALEFEPQLRHYLHEAGVSLALVPALPRTHVSGVARWLNPHSPMIQLSLYGKSNDKFWFTFFHEAAHILLHSHEKKSVFLDDPSKTGANTQEEDEANAWSRNTLIPNSYLARFSQIKKSKTEVNNFAKEIGIHPGIVVGRLQHEKIIEISWMNDLKVSYLFAEN